LVFRARARQLLARFFEEPGVRALHFLKLSPNAVTLLGLVLTLGVTYLAARGAFLYAGLLFLVASALDMLDGALARLTGKVTRFGAALDSVTDRLSEALLLLGLVLFYLDQGNDTGVILAFVAVVASYMVSYLRSRGEGLGIVMKETGLGTRTERVIVMVVGLLTGWVLAALWVVAVLSVLTSGQRLYHLWRMARD